MDEKLSTILATPDFEAWRAGLWKEISAEAIAHGWVERRDVREDGTVSPESARWGQLFLRLVCFVHFVIWVLVREKGYKGAKTTGRRQIGSVREMLGVKSEKRIWRRH
jgi:hypothetical protein